MIHVDNLSKVYRVTQKQPGLAGSLKSIFRRRYDEVRAVTDLSFHIPPGARVGFLGPNGAGKTTTLKMLAGLLHPTAGAIRVAGYKPFDRSPDFLASIALVMGQKQQLIWDLPPRETFELNRAIYGIERNRFDANMGELIELLELEHLIGRPTRNLSLGERMKCELCAALVHGPRVLFLDEPTIGLDVAMQIVLRDFIRAYNERSGATVILTSHYMNDVEALCPRVIIIDDGRLRYDGDLGALVERTLPDKQVALRFASPVARADLEPFGTLHEHNELGATLHVRRADLNAHVAAILGRLPVVDLSIEDPPLEDVMRQVFTRSTPDAPTP